MTDHVDERARRAGAAVHERTTGMDPDRGLADVVRRGRRPRPTTTLAVILVVLLAVPGAVWLRDLTDTRIDLETPVDTPESPAPVEEDPEETEEPSPVPTVPAVPDRTEPEPPPTPPGPDPAAPFGTEEVSDGNFPFGGGEYALLTDVRVAGHDRFDRVVLEFDGPDMPSYRVGYVDPPIIQDGSGEEIAVAGAAFLQLQLTPASGVDSVGTDWVPVYEGPFRVTGSTSLVTEVVRTGDFEANLGWVIGLERRAPFAVTVLAEPLRLVVDIDTR